MSLLIWTSLALILNHMIGKQEKSLIPAFLIGTWFSLWSQDLNCMDFIKTLFLMGIAIEDMAWLKIRQIFLLGTLITSLLTPILFPLWAWLGLALFLGLCVTRKSLGLGDLYLLLGSCLSLDWSSFHKALLLSSGLGLLIYIFKTRIKKRPPNSPIAFGCLWVLVYIAFW